MKLGIFGDSYGISSVRDNDIPDLSWVQIIANTGKYTVTNYCIGGSDLWFSYQKFVTHQHEFNKIIFLVTNPHRVYLPKVDLFTNFANAKLRAGLFDGELKTQYQLAVSYYENLHNFEKDELCHELVVEKIKSIRSDIILYPCFDLPYLKDFSLVEITNFEDLALGLTSDIRQRFNNNKLRDSRKCHMIGENNLVVANMFMDRLEGKNTTLSREVLKTPNKPIEYYYQSRIWS
jgi:hypothetical protein